MLRIDPLLILFYESISLFDSRVWAPVWKLCDRVKYSKYSTLVLSRTGGALSHLNTLTQVLSIPTEELVHPCHARCVFSRLRCNGHSLLLGSYLSRIGRIENPSCSACGHSSQDTFYLILHCPTMDSLRRTLFGDSLSLYDLWSRPWELLGFWGSHPSEGIG